MILLLTFEGFIFYLSICIVVTLMQELHVVLIWIYDVGKRILLIFESCSRWPANPNLVLIKAVGKVTATI
jgi:hypothetical protein